jgi:hypothetical protein
MSPAWALAMMNPLSTKKNSTPASPHRNGVATHGTSKYLASAMMTPG